jgi:hypothetical protein
MRIGGTLAASLLAYTLTARVAGPAGVRAHPQEELGNQ